MTTLTRTRRVDDRPPECVAAWPDAESFEYDPRCCRFPKSCSAGYGPDFVSTCWQQGKLGDRLLDCEIWPGHKGMHSALVDGYRHGYHVDSPNPRKRGVRWTRSPSHPPDPRCPECAASNRGAGS